MKAVFDQTYVKRLSGTNVKTGKNKFDLAEQLIDDIAEFKRKNNCDRLVMIWAASTEIFLKPHAVHRTLEVVRKGDARQPQSDRAVDDLCLRRFEVGHSVRQRRAESDRRYSGFDGSGERERRRRLRQRFQDRPDVDEDDPRSGTEIAHARTATAGIRRTSSATATAKCSTILSPSKPRKNRSCRCSNTFFSRKSIRSSTRIFRTSSASTTTHRAATTKKAGTTSTSLAGSATRCRSRSISSAAIRSWPRRSFSTWRCFLDLAQRAGMKGVQEWLSFYFKSPMTAPGLYPEHDIFIQLMKLKNTLRHLRGEDLITHLGLEYYD